MSARPILALAGAFLFLAGCRSEPQRLAMDLPENFLELERSRAEFKATSPRDARLWVKRFEDENDGDLAFWVQTLRNDLLSNRSGYVPTGEPRTIVAADGSRGTAMEFTSRIDGIEVGYLIAVWDGDHEVVTAEFLAPVDEWAECEDDIRAALATLTF